MFTCFPSSTSSIFLFVFAPYPCSSQKTFQKIFQTSNNAISFASKMYVPTSHHLHCHSQLQITVFCHFSPASPVTWSPASDFHTLSTWTVVYPWTVVCQAPLSIGFPRQKYWGGLLFPSPGDLPRWGIERCLLHWQVDSLPVSHQRSPWQPLSIGDYPLNRFFVFLAMLSGMWDLSSLTRDQTRVSWNGNVES